VLLRKEPNWMANSRKKPFLRSIFIKAKVHPQLLIATAKKRMMPCLHWEYYQARTLIFELKSLLKNVNELSERLYEKIKHVLITYNQNRFRENRKLIGPRRKKIQAIQEALGTIWQKES